jgi:hypothetical protein
MTKVLFKEWSEDWSKEVEPIEDIIIMKEEDSTMLIKSKRKFKIGI